MKTTLNKIREHNPCEDSWKKLLNHLGKTEADDEPLEIKTILDSNGIEDAVWAFRSVDGHDKDIRLFVCDCAESVLHLFENEFPDDNRLRNAIEIARRFANGECNNDELRAARDAAEDAVKAAFDAAENARYTAAYAASNAVWYASNAVWSTTEATSSETLPAASNAAWAVAWAKAAKVAKAAKDAEKKKQVKFLMKYI